ncbi:probable inactive peptidyl-prolyl cis-trans isomerase-like 6 isoform X1 [Amphibalanus amphitrite]|uniref:probable inactive peptidyl-prolyl cis-trans isomerase-like 6 isoform X1 n=1 Tax=Amphibalanus amphitrite TaxID=1232801 RepID=UPI001C916A9A|nr:probable inactive peptidyl-prolyl cis-trans isomerase-like 6 isoform X1 [Amphibalanus amphitrite]XP_043213597.1 probable inactive peptidyl-prolyl cis-trans isomerase-like 6 isoform X1 [Amphibalanus amphitrite]XP_043213605.1 probable inactive peptidyl-prolyl cis-trans isomerase-like 6 isoform X1 [Amphibalanus amphitrite]XP_043213623.1 probable inactive peptidyl-prolyl cis-trans isomerase-like 6 isoform X1 [Amphibalanus amphitrite]
MAAAELPPLEAVWVSPSMGAAPPARFVPVHLQVYGVAGSAQLAALAGCAQHLHRRRPNLFLRAPHVLPMYEAEWSAFVDNLRKLVTGGEAWCLSGPAVLFCDSQYVGDLDRAVDWITETFGIPIDLEEIETPGDIYRQTMLARKNSVVFLDVSYDGRAVGRLVFELFDELLPRASRNFRQLCSGRGGVSARSGTVLWYAGTPVHRIVRGGWLQAGDIVDGCGAHGESVFGAPFADECFAVAHDRRGRLSMVEDERNANTSQFMVAFGPMTYMQNLCCAFGQLIEGSAVLDYLETVETNNERPMRTVAFTNGGVLHEPSGAGRLASFDLCDADLADWSPPVEPPSEHRRVSGAGSAVATPLDYIVPVGRD